MLDNYYYGGLLIFSLEEFINHNELYLELQKLVLEQFPFFKPSKKSWWWLLLFPFILVFIFMKHQNPMQNLYRQEPDFSFYTMDPWDKKRNKDFWNDP